MDCLNALGVGRKSFDETLDGGNDVQPENKAPDGGNELGPARHVSGNDPIASIPAPNRKCTPLRDRVVHARESPVP